jgi:hypothetical protein
MACSRFRRAAAPGSRRRRAFLLPLAALGPALCLGNIAEAANRLFMEDLTVSPGEDTVELIVQCDNEVELFGVSVALAFDPAVVQIESLETAGVAEGAEWQPPQDLLIDLVDNEEGQVFYGFITEFDGLSKSSIPPGTRQPILRIEARLLEPSETRVEFRDDLGGPNPALGFRNLLVDRTGQTYSQTSVDPLVLEGATISVDAAPAGSFIRGDVNGDLQTDMSDAVAILLDLFGGQPASAPCRDALDVNDDGAIEIADAIALLSSVFTGEYQIPPPHPQPGVDVAEDSLPGC